MRPVPSPLDHLTAFAVAFAAGALSTVSLITYLDRVRCKAVREHCKRADEGPSLPSAPAEKRSIEK